MVSPKFFDFRGLYFSVFFMNMHGELTDKNCLKLMHFVFQKEDVSNRDWNVMDLSLNLAEVTLFLFLYFVNFPFLEQELLRTI